MTNILYLSKTHQITSKWRQFCAHRNYFEQSTSKQRRILAQKLCWKSSWNQHGNSLIFSFRSLDVISTSSRRSFDMLRMLGTQLFMVPPVVIRLELFESQRSEKPVKPASKCSEKVTIDQPITHDTGRTIFVSCERNICKNV